MADDSFQSIDGGVPPLDGIGHEMNKPPLLGQKCYSVISQDSLGSIVINDGTPVASETNLEGCDVTGPRAPDGGYGWVILVAVYLSFCTAGYMIGSFPVMYVALVERYGSDRGVTGWVGSMYNFTGHIFGIVIGAYVKKYGCRAVAIIGALVGTAGIALSSIHVNIPYLYLTYGVLAGFGNAMVFIPNLVILQQYFDKRRTLALGIGTAGVSAGAMLAAPIVSYFLWNYGISGTYLISSGLWLQNLVFASMYRPVRCLSAKAISTDTDSVTVDSSSSLHKVTKHIWIEAADCSPMKNSKLLLFIIGNFMSFVGITPFFAHYLGRMTFLGLEERLCIILQTALEGTTFASRIIFSLVGNIKGVNRVIFFATVATLGGVVVFFFSLVHSEVLLVMFGVLLGIITGGYFSMQHAVLVDISGVETITKTTGILSMTLSVSILLGIPLAGFVFDVTGNYDYPFMVNGSIHIVGGILLIVLAVLHLR